jgi:drug/metabolite transporter (DMT)-like permease
VRSEPAQLTTRRGEAPAPNRHLAALAAMCLIWGSTFLAIRIGTETVAPIWAAALRLLIATPLYLAIARAAGAFPVSGPALRSAVGYGVLNYGINFTLLYWGEARIPSGTAAVIYATIPLTTSVFAALLRVHPFERHEAIGSLVGLGGVTLVFSGELTSGAPAGALAAVAGAATASALSAVVLKRGPSQSTWTANGVGAAAGAIICVAASAASGERLTLPRDARAWAPIIYLVVAGNLGAYALYGWLVARWNVVRINVIALVIPLIAVALGALLRREALPPATYAGAAIVLGGVAVTLMNRERGVQPPRR